MRPSRLAPSYPLVQFVSGFQLFPSGVVGIHFSDGPHAKIAVARLLGRERYTEH
jgi:hypothetical protein